mgnify:CR=1 FL=1
MHNDFLPRILFLGWAEYLQIFLRSMGKTVAHAAGDIVTFPRPHYLLLISYKDLHLPGQHIPDLFLEVTVICLLSRR